MTRTYYPSIKTIATRLSWLDSEQVKQIRGLIDGSVNPLEASSWVRNWNNRHQNEPTKIEQIINAIDEVMNTHGVESLYTGWDNYLQHPTAIYCNTGETYTPTVVYCYKTERFKIMSWGDYYEQCGELRKSEMQ